MNMGDKYMFTIIMPVFQTPNILTLCIDSLIKSISMPTSLILIDDFSPIESQEVLSRFSSSEHPLVKITLLRHHQGLGCPKSINEGLSLASEDGYIVFADSDIIFPYGWQERVHQDLQGDESIGGVGGVLLYPQTGGIQNCGISYNSFRGRHTFLNNHPEYITNMGCFPVQATVFAFFAARAELVKKTGKLDEGYYNGYEDIDFQLRMKQLGYKIVIDSRITMYHWEKSNGNHRAFSRRQNLGRFWAKNHQYIRNDMISFLLPFLKQYAQTNQEYIGVDMSEARTEADTIWTAIESVLSIKRIVDVSANCIASKKLWLPDLLSSDFFCTRNPIAFFCDNFTQITENHYWFSRRAQYCKDDLVIDSYANVLPTSHLELFCWPGSKIR